MQKKELFLQITIARTAYYAQLPILAAKCIFDNALDATEDNVHCSPLTSHTTVPYVSPIYSVPNKMLMIGQLYLRRNTYTASLYYSNERYVNEDILLK